VSLCGRSFIFSEHYELYTASSRSYARFRKIDRLVYSPANGFGQHHHFSGIVVSRTKGITELTVAQAREQLADPLRISNCNSLEETAILTTVAEGDAISFDLINDPR
jgi:hypothetical protein